mmetsp:Transcript_82117/g.143271  ORF Transcript_82117/g.143271 Transcript_82117/m.143271 type:complete len:218 (+) Transcript_82117:30-683(+)
MEKEATFIQTEKLIGLSQVETQRERRASQRKRRKKKSLDDLRSGKCFQSPGSHVLGGRIHILANYGNTQATLTDLKGSVVRWASGGTAGFKNTKKKTPLAARAVVRKLIKDARVLFGIKHVQVTVSGSGWGRAHAVWALAKSGVRILNIKCKTSVPYNGCRPRKRRKIRRRTKRQSPPVGPFKPLQNNVCKLFLKRGGILKRFLTHKQRRRARRRRY